MLAGVGAWAARRTSAPADTPAYDGPDMLAFDTGGDVFGGTLDSFDPMGSIEAWMQQNVYESHILSTTPAPLPQAQANLAAMLQTIKQSEGTADRGDPYRVCFGYRHTIASMADHPAITGEWRGEPLSAALCAGAGLGPGCVSTAAGAYQIIKPTWIPLKLKLGLLDFSPASQDAAAVELLRQRGALKPLYAGDFAGAIYAARKEWASLTGAGYGQGERSLAWLTDRFTQAGGVLA